MVSGTDFVAVAVNSIVALTNQITWFCKTYVGRTQPRSSYVKICNLLDIVNVIGTATGALIGGYAFDFVQDFTLMALAAALLTLLALCRYHRPPLPFAMTALFRFRTEYRARPDQYP